ncbi:MAG: hypothetical protein IPP48_12935 [Chitinophagaceae bacterium]|nr:hypothetical protein [Chitinophagaceae bacterium]
MKYFTTLLLAVTIALTANAQTEIKKEYYKNGKIKSETPYVDGKITGIKKEYYKNGILESEKPVINGEANGTLKWYFESGVLRLVADYVNNKRNGVQKWYYESGNIQSEAIFKDGEMISINTFADVKTGAKTNNSNDNIAVSAPIAQPKTEEVVTPVHNDNKPVTKTVSTPIINKNNGCVSGDCENGFGTYKWPNGETYTGDFKNAKRDGIGTYTNSKGEVFAGAWKNNEWFESGCLTGDCENGFGTYVFKYYSSFQELPI